MQYKYEHKFSFESPMKNTVPDKLISQNLSSVSTSDIQSFFNRINFYLEHFSIVNKRSKTQANETKVNLLKNLQSVLKSEMENRQNVSACV